MEEYRHFKGPLQVGIGGQVGFGKGAELASMAGARSSDHVDLPLFHRNMDPRIQRVEKVAILGRQAARYGTTAEVTTGLSAVRRCAARAGQMERFAPACQMLKNPLDHGFRR